MDMRTKLKRKVRVKLLQTGGRVGAKGQHRLRSLHSYLELGDWAKNTLGGLPPEYVDKEPLWEVAVNLVTGARPLYLEFGVYQGASLRWWAEHLTTPEARFIGFDSFEGLPEDWNTGRRKGAFAVEQVPQIRDERVSLKVGWFDETVPAFEVPPHDQLIVNIDCDLYSSTALVLDHLEPFLVPKTLLYFDELNDRDHEFRALKELLARSGKSVRPLGFSRGGTNWLLEVSA